MEITYLGVGIFWKKLESLMSAYQRALVGYMWEDLEKLGRKEMFLSVAPSKVAFTIKPKLGHFPHRASYPASTCSAVTVPAAGALEWPG